MPNRIAISRLGWLMGVTVAVALVAACGWHLRGSGQGGLAGQRLVLESKASDATLSKRSRQALRRLGVEIVAPTEQAPVLVVLGARTNRRTIATDDDGRASAWELEYQLRFRLLAAASDPEEAAEPPLISTASVRSSDTYAASPLDNQAEQAQRRRLTDELREEAIRLMLSRVASALEP